MYQLKYSSLEPNWDYLHNFAAVILFIFIFLENV